MRPWAAVQNLGKTLESRAAQIRDMVAYFVACAVTLELLWDGKFSAREAGLLVGLYFAYLLICISTSKCEGPPPELMSSMQHTGSSPGKGSWHALAPVADKQACLYWQFVVHTWLWLWSARHF